MALRCLVGQEWSFITLIAFNLQWKVDELGVAKILCTCKSFELTKASVRNEAFRRLALGSPTVALPNRPSLILWSRCVLLSYPMGSCWGPHGGQAFPDWKWQTSFPYFKLHSTSLRSLEVSVGEGFCCPSSLDAAGLPDPFFSFKLLRHDIQICRTLWETRLEHWKKINEHQLSIEMRVCGAYGSSPKRAILRAVAAEPCSIRGSKAGAAWSNLRFPHLSMYNNMVLMIDVSNTIYPNMCVTYIVYGVFIFVSVHMCMQPNYQTAMVLCEPLSPNHISNMGL